MSAQRYPTGVRFIGVMQKDVNKMFMVSVLWSDASEIIVYRSFQDFKKLHKQLKKQFPLPNPFRRSERVIPRFRARTMKTYQRKDPSKSLRRLALLENYCAELLKCEPAVTHSSEVVQFFLPQNQDLQPEFAKNSIVILPLEDGTDSRGGVPGGIGGKRFSTGNVTQPFVTETYRCVAPYETKDTKNRPFKVAVDETVDVLIKDKAGWWLVENEGKCLAWFPAPYLERCDDEEEDDDDDDETAVDGKLYCAVRNYTSAKADELSVKIGSVVEVLQKSADGWWLIRDKGKAGYVPSMYLRPYHNPLLQFHREMHSSTLNLAQLHSPEGSTLPDLAHSARGPRPLRPMGALLSAAARKRSHSLDVLSETPHSPAPTPVTMEQEHRKDSLGGASEGGASEGGASEFSFSDDSSSTAGESTSPGHSDQEDRLYESSAPSGLASDLAEGRVTPIPSEASLLRGPPAPRVPPRPKDQEILSRCTTFTRKAALASKARLFPEMPQAQGR
ncbi:hypothetical protein JZ751_006528 [Albula glossodonta]|uniref:NADPH oxidase organizer 1 n=1 Tax=Albula glossodonta TaxID=121402 RepID=A0A8T2N2U1_9TELE|nr:hypothetical protein JZ751_006528 [Albula glossodonta]